MTRVLNIKKYYLKNNNNPLSSKSKLEKSRSQHSENYKSDAAIIFMKSLIIPEIIFMDYSWKIVHF